MKRGFSKSITKPHLLIHVAYCLFVGETRLLVRCSWRVKEARRFDVDNVDDDDDVDNDLDNNEDDDDNF